MTGDEPVRRVNIGRYRLGPYEIVKSSWNSWAIFKGHSPGPRVQVMIDLAPTKKEAVADVRRWLALPESCRP